jgi:hypothetical protein
MKPDPQLPGNLEGAEAAGMVAVEAMGGVISCRAQVMEESCHLTLD